MVNINRIIADELKVAESQVAAAVALLDEGATIPFIARYRKEATGGLDDTIAQYDEIQGTGTGFKFWDPSAAALHNTIGWAVSTYFDRPVHMQQMIQQAMTQNFSWDRSAEAYVRLYEQARQARA